MMPHLTSALRAAAFTVAALAAVAARPDAAAAMTLPQPAQAAAAAIQPVYWAYDRFGRRVWIERRYDPPPRYYPREHHRRGWVDRYGRWHPYYR